MYFINNIIILVRLLFDGIVIGIRLITAFVKRYKQYLYISATLIICIFCLVSYYFLSNNFMSYLYRGTKLLVNVVEMAGIFSIIISVKKYKESKNRKKFSETMNIIKKIQKEMYPIASFNKMDKDIFNSKKITTTKIINDTIIKYNKRAKKIGISKNIRRNAIKKIKNNTPEDKRIIIFMSAKERVISSILTKANIQAMYIIHGYADMNLSRTELKGTINEFFINNKKYINLLRKNNPNLLQFKNINILRKLWKISK